MKIFYCPVCDKYSSYAEVDFICTLSVELSEDDKFYSDIEDLDTYEPEFQKLVENNKLILPFRCYECEGSMEVKDIPIEDCPHPRWVEDSYGRECTLCGKRQSVKQVYEDE